jgi:DNA repair protein RadA/Sms
VLGEIGLAGEIRGIAQVETRLSEARKMGFQRCLIPSANRKRVADTQDIDVIGIENLAQAMETLFLTKFLEK